MSSSAMLLMYVPHLRDLVVGVHHKGGLPDDFLERLKDMSATVNLGEGWQRLAEAFAGSSSIMSGADYDILFLDDETESDALQSLREEYAEVGDGSPKAYYLMEAIEALEGMRDTRTALGLDNAIWELA